MDKIPSDLSIGEELFCYGSKSLQDPLSVAGTSVFCFKFKGFRIFSD